jgi:hypothetical protein
MLKASGPADVGEAWRPAPGSRGWARAHPRVLRPTRRRLRGAAVGVGLRPSSGAEAHGQRGRGPPQRGGDGAPATTAWPAGPDQEEPDRRRRRPPGTVHGRGGWWSRISPRVRQPRSARAVPLRFTAFSGSRRLRTPGVEQGVHGGHVGGAGARGPPRLDGVWARGTREHQGRTGSRGGDGHAQLGTYRSRYGRRRSEWSRRGQRLRPRGLVSRARARAFTMTVGASAASAKSMDRRGSSAGCARLAPRLRGPIDLQERRRGG